jgi:hypothetical protein
MSQLSQFLSTLPSPAMPSSHVTPLPSTQVISPTTPSLRTPKIQDRQQSLEALTTASGAIVVELRTAIQESAVSDDADRLAQLLTVNDELIAMMTRILSLDETRACEDNAGVVGKRPKLVLQGLGLTLDGNTSGYIPVPEIEKNEPSTDVPPKPDTDTASSTGSSAASINGDLNTPNQAQEEDPEANSPPTTPRADKGKGRAEPEEEEPEKVLSPSYVIDSGESEEEEEKILIPEEVAALVQSPNERYAFYLPLH